MWDQIKATYLKSLTIICVQAGKLTWYAFLLFFSQHQEATSRAAAEEAAAVDNTAAASDSGRGSTTDQLQTDSMQTDSFELAQEALPQENVSTYGCFNKRKVFKTGFGALLYGKSRVYM